MIRLRARQVRHVPQMESTECAAACLAMVLDCYGGPVPLAELRESCGVSRDGVSAHALLEAAASYGLRARALRAKAAALGQLRLPMVLHWENNHFVVLAKLCRGRAEIVDPGSGHRTLSLGELERSFSGVAIELSPASGFQRRKRVSPSLTQYLQLLSGTKGAFAFVALAGLTQELLGVVMPAASQVMIDYVIEARRGHWLAPIMLALAAASAAQMLARWLRDSSLQTLHANLSGLLASRFCEHLFALSPAFFGARSAGDLIQRVEENAALREPLTKIVAGAFDGILVVTYGALMMAYDAQLGALTVAINALRLGLSHGVTAFASKHIGAELAAGGKEQTAQLEAITSPETIKGFGAERAVLSRYTRRMTERVHWSARSSRRRETGGQLLPIVDAAGYAAVIWVGGRAVLDGEMTLGVLSGYLTIQAMLQVPLAGLFDALGELVRAKAVLVRADDVMSSPRVLPGTTTLPELHGNIELRDVSFRHGHGGAWLLQHVSLRIAAGEHVAFVGPSGGGKSTLLKLCSGQLLATRGEVLLDGHPLRDLDPQWLARRMGVVCQESFVLACSVVENVSLRRPDASSAQLREASETAQLEPVLRRLSRGWSTPVSRDGGNLSGGERQRLALARAVLGSPRILLLDEATHALDAQLEAQVLARLSGVRTTRLTVAHRRSALAGATRVFEVSGGRVEEVSGAPELTARWS